MAMPGKLQVEQVEFHSGKRMSRKPTNNNVLLSAFDATGPGIAVEEVGAGSMMLL